MPFSYDLIHVTQKKSLQSVREGYYLQINTARHVPAVPRTNNPMKHFLILFLIGGSLVSCRDHRQTEAEEGSSASLAKILQLEAQLEIAKDEIKDIRDGLRDVGLLKEEQTKRYNKLGKVEGAQDDSRLIVQQLTAQHKDSQESIDRLASRQTETGDQLLNLARRVLRISDAVEASEKQTRNDHNGELPGERDAQIIAIKERVARLSQREKELELALSPKEYDGGFGGAHGRAAWMKKDRELKEPLIKDLQNVRELLLQENRRLNELITGS